MPVMAVNNQTSMRKPATIGPGPGGRRARSWRPCCGCSAVSLSKSSPGSCWWRRTGWPPGATTFLEGGKEGLKGQRPDRSAEDRALRQAQRKIGQLTMENEILRAAAEKRGVQIPPGKRPR
jgi:hypothetical protein